MNNLIKEYFLVTKVEVKTKPSGLRYLDLIITDYETEMHAIMPNYLAIEPPFKPMTIQMLHGYVMHNGEFVFVVEHIGELSDK